MKYRFEQSHETTKLVEFFRVMPLDKTTSFDEASNSLGFCFTRRLIRRASTR